MSQIMFTDDQQRFVRCGWDPVLGTFFFDVFDAGPDANPDAPPLYEFPMLPGTRKLAELVEAVQDAGFDELIPFALIDRLDRHRQANSGALIEQLEWAALSDWLPR